MQESTKVAQTQKQKVDKAALVREGSRLCQEVNHALKVKCHATKPNRLNRPDYSSSRQPVTGNFQVFLNIGSDSQGGLMNFIH